MGASPDRGPFAGIRRWLRERSPLITRRAHDARIAELRSAADGLLDSVQTLGEATRTASSAWTENAQVWQATAARYRRERNAALEEVDRLRATVASLVLGEVTSGPDGQ